MSKNTPQRRRFFQKIAAGALLTVPFMVKKQSATWEEFLRSATPDERSKFEIVMDIFKIAYADQMVDDYYFTVDKMFGRANFKNDSRRYLEQAAMAYVDFFSKEELLAFKVFHESSAGRRHAEFIRSKRFTDAVLVQPLATFKQEQAGSTENT